MGEKRSRFESSANKRLSRGLADAKKREIPHFLFRTLAKVELSDFFILVYFRILFVLL